MLEVDACWHTEIVSASGVKSLDFGRFRALVFEDFACTNG